MRQHTLCTIEGAWDKAFTALAPELSFLLSISDLPLAHAFILCSSSMAGTCPRGSLIFGDREATDYFLNASFCL